MGSTAAEIVRTMDRLERGQESIIKSQADIYDKVHSLDIKIADLPCKVHGKDIGLLQKVVYGVVGLILVAFVGTIIYPNDPKKQTRKMRVKQSQQIEYYESIDQIPRIIRGEIIMVKADSE